MIHYIDLIYEDKDFYYISYTNNEILNDIGGAFYIDFTLTEQGLKFNDIFHNIHLNNTFIPIFLLDYIELLEGMELSKVKDISLSFFNCEKVIFNGKKY